MKKLLLIALLANALPCFSQQNDLKLWYNTPSGDLWTNALPVGNGRLGAMVYGNVGRETIQLNEHTLWSGSPNRNDNPLALDSLASIRQLIYSGKQKQAEQLANKVIISKQSQGQMFEPAGELQLSFAGQDSFTNYYRELDIQKAVAKTVYTVGDTRYTREVLASLPDRVIVMHLTASRPHSISFAAYYTTPQTDPVIKTTAGGELIMGGKVTDHEGVKGLVRYEVITHFTASGGSRTATDTSILIKGADSVTIFISIATNFKNYHDISGNEHQSAVGYLAEAVKKPFASILRNHVLAYQKYFGRVQIELGTSAAAALPTDERLKNFSAASDPQFAALYFQYGRYLLISSSQPGGQPANLQGIWNNKIRPPWDSKYTININTEMNYWPAEKTNLAEMHDPLLKMVQELAVTGQQTAHDMYGARGWMAHHNTDIWRINGAS